MHGLERDLGGKSEWTWHLERQGLGARQREMLGVIPRLLVRYLMEGGSFTEAGGWKERRRGKTMNSVVGMLSMKCCGHSIGVVDSAGSHMNLELGR